MFAATVPETSAADAVVLALALALAATLELAAAPLLLLLLFPLFPPLLLLPPLFWLAAPVFAAALAVTVTVVGAGHDPVDDANPPTCVAEAEAAAATLVEAPVLFC